MRLLASLAYLAVLFFSCETSEKKTYKVGFSQPIMDNWRDAMNNEVQRELLFQEDLEVVFRDAGGDSYRQILQIEELLKDGIDLLIVSPNEAGPIRAVIEQVYQQGIPVILLDRRINSEQYTAYVGADNHLIGREAGRYIAGFLNGSGRVLEAYENLSITPFFDRHRGFREVIKNYPEIQVDSVSAMNAGAEQYAEMIDSIQYDAVFAPTDVAAYFAYQIAEELGRNDAIDFVGIDGLPGEGGGLDLVERGILKASILYPTGGDVAIQVASDILHQRDFVKENILQTTVIDAANVKIMQMQTNKLLDQQQDINRLAEKIEVVLGVFQTQRNLTYLFAFTMVLSILMTAYVFKALVEKRRTNEELKAKNDQILAFSQKAEEATQAKFKFFTNISHEFRTPLTLINAPVEDLLNNKEASLFRNDLLLVKKNAMRLLRLVNQIMDFRKIDTGKMKLNVAEYDLVLFLRDIIGSFEKTAKDRKIEFKLLTDDDSIMLWFDQSMMDKVVFNLLSNAFKFTSHGGSVFVRVKRNVLNNTVQLVVEDTGKGMSEQQLNLIFDRFYQGDRNNRAGTGLGLALSKEIIQLHQGGITVESVLEKGTRFSIEMKMGNDHFEKDEIIAASPDHYILDASMLFTDYPTEFRRYEEATVEMKEHSVLIIEDNLELRGYLVSRLANDYSILEADSVESGIKMAFDDVPDLIVCDLMLHDESGYDVIRKLKSDIRSSHIPIIILSAKSSTEEKLQGIRLGADDYITKPFVYSLLSERINTLLVNRQKLREHYIHELPVDQSTSSPSKIDKKFVNQFTAIIEDNLGDSNFGVNDIVREMGLSRVQLYRKVKAILGYSVNDYINSVRLKKAKHLIHNDEFTITEVAYKVGYSTPAYFSTAFKNHFGMTPTEFKAKGTN